VASTLNTPGVAPPKSNESNKDVNSAILLVASTLNSPIVAPPKSNELNTTDFKDIPEAKEICKSIKKDIDSMKTNIIKIKEITDVDLITSNLEDLIININSIIRLSNKLNIGTFVEFKKQKSLTETFNFLNSMLDTLLLNIKPVAETNVVEAVPKVAGPKAAAGPTKEELNSAILLVASEPKEDGVQQAVAESKEGARYFNGQIIYDSKI
jgi:hypothetical protein